jgi:hypothetical protein
LQRFPSRIPLKINHFFTEMGVGGSRSRTGHGAARVPPRAEDSHVKG